MARGHADRLHRNLVEPCHLECVPMNFFLSEISLVDIIQWHLTQVGHSYGITNLMLVGGEFQWVCSRLCLLDVHEFWYS